MLKGIFNPDNAVFRAVAKFGYIWYLNILWVITSLPIITIGASTTALCYSCMKLRKEEGYITKNYFKSFKENFKQSTVIWLAYLLVGLLIMLGLIFWNNATLPFAQIAWAVVLLIGILYFVSSLYVFAIQSRFYNKVKDTIKFSFLLAYKNLKETILMALIVVAVVVINMFTTFIVNFITLNVGVALVIYLLSSHYEKIFSLYIDEPEDPDIVEE